SGELPARDARDWLTGRPAGPSLAAAWAARGRTVRHIRTHHAPAAVRAAMLAVARATAVGAVIAVSHAAAAPYAPLRGRLHVIPNGVDLAVAQAARAAPRLRREHHIASDSFLVGAAGRLVAHKGLAVLPRAAAMLRQTRFAILGGNPRHEAGDALATLRATMPADTIFTGWLAEPEPYVADLDVLV